MRGSPRDASLALPSDRLENWGPGEGQGHGSSTHLLLSLLTGQLLLTPENPPQTPPVLAPPAPYALVCGQPEGRVARQEARDGQRGDKHVPTSES